MNLWTGRILLALAALVTLGSIPSLALAQSTAFTYQGQLKNGGALAEGQHDFRFRLFDAASGGTQVGSTQCVDNILVKDGVFTALIDFGPQFTTTSQRFIEILVRRDIGQSCADTSGFATLAPRQVISASPLATHAKSAFSLDAADGSPANVVFVDNSGKVGIGTTSPQSLLHVNGTMMWGGQAQNYAWSGQDSNGLYLEQAGDSVVRSRMRVQSSKASDFLNYAQLNIDPYNGFSFMGLGTGNGNVGIGTTTPGSKLTVLGNVQLGDGADLFAPGGQENLRIVRGFVSAEGNKIEGLGYTSVRTGEGQYTITFTTPFVDPPAVFVTANLYSGFKGGHANTGSITTSSVYVQTGAWTDTFQVVIDSPFSFMAIGPR